jgi:hypothetical protein
MGDAQLGRWPSQCGGQDLVTDLIGERGPRRWLSRPVLQTGQALLREPASPQHHCRFRALHPLGDLRPSQALGGQQHDPRSLHIPSRRTTIANTPLQHHPIRLRNLQNAHPIQHAPLSHHHTEH